MTRRVIDAEGKELMSDVAKYLNLRETHVYALVRRGELPAIKLGWRGVWRVDRERLEGWLDDLHERTAQWTRSQAQPDHRGRPPRRRFGPRTLAH